MPIVAKQIDIGSTLEQIRQQFNNLQSDVTTLQASPTYGTAIIFEGTSNDDYETSLTAQDPTADRTIYLPNENGTVLTTASVVNSDTSTITANNSTDETVYPIFVDGATGTQGLESDNGFTYNPSSGDLRIVNLVIDDAGLIGSATDRNAIAISSAGVVTLSATDSLVTSGTTVHNEDVTFTGASYNVLWDKSDNRLEFGDNAKLSFGASEDLTIYHSGSHSDIIDSGTGNLRLLGSQIDIASEAADETMASFVDDGAVTLYHDNSAKIATSAAGISVTGTATMSANVVIADAGSIGSASDTNAITISSGGVVAVTATTANTNSSDGALTVAGGVGILLDLSVGDDVRLTSDAAVLNFGADNDVTLTHVADTGLLLNSTRQIQFGDAGTYIHQSADGVLDLVSDTELELNATTIDINGNVEVSGTLAQVGVGTFTARSVHNGGITIADDGQIGTTSDLDAMTISAAGVVTMSQNLIVTGDLTVNGTTTTVSTSNTIIGDSLIELNNGAGSNANDLGIVMERGSTGDNAIIAWDESADKFTMGTTTATGASTGNLSITAGTLVVSALEGTLSTAAQANITSVGTLTALTVDNIAIDGTTIGHTGDTDLMTLAAGVLTVAGRVDASDDIYLTGDEKAIRWYNGSNYVTLAASSSLSSNIAFKLPTADGSAGQALITDASGNLSFAANNIGNATTLSVSANNSTDETVYPTFVDGATGEQGFETDTALTYNPSTGLLSTAAITLTGALTVGGTTTLNGNLVLGDAAADTLNIGATILGASPLTFEGGTADGHETTFAITDPTADRTITFPNLTGTVSLITATETLTNKTLTAPVINTATVGTSITPASDDGATLGSANLNWSDLYLADGGVIYFGDDQDIPLTHVADTGLRFDDSDKLMFGASSDFKFYHDGTNSYVDNVTGGIYMRTNDTENAIVAEANSGVIVYYDGSEKFRTTTAGVDITGGLNVNTDYNGLFTGAGGTAKLAVVGESSSTSVVGNTDAAMMIANKDGTADNTAGIHFARADTDENPNYAGASIVAQFTATQVTGQYPPADLNFLTSPSANAAPTLKMTLAANGNLNVTGTVTAAAFSGPLTGNVTGNADTATALATGRTIGMTGDVVWTSASFTGAGNVTGTSTIQSGAVEGGMIANDAVDSQHYAADSIDEEHLANDCVGSAELKTLSTLLIKNSSGSTLKTIHGAGA